MINSYIYISQSKIDMIVGQMTPKTCGKINAELGFNFGLLNGKLTTQKNAGDSENINIIQSLKMAERFIEEEGPIVSLAEPGEWVKGKIEVRHVSLEGNQSIFLVVGKYNNNIILLAGSAAHIMGFSNPEPVYLGASYLPHLVGSLEGSLKKLESKSDKWLEARKKFGEVYDSGNSADEFCSTIYCLYKYSNSITFNVEFLGRRLFLKERNDGITCSMISPLYVCHLP